MDTNDVGKPIEVNRNGNRIIGIWKNDKLHGDVQIYYHNGVTFKYIPSYIEVSTRTVSKFGAILHF